MSILDKIIKHSVVTSLEAHESFCAILIGIAAVDGKISEEEITDFMSTFNKSKTLAHLNKSQFSSMINNIIDINKHQGTAKLLEMGIKALPEHLRKSTFINACDLIYSDGRVVKEELNALIMLRDALNLDEVEAAQISEIIQEKNNL